MATPPADAESFDGKDGVEQPPGVGVIHREAEGAEETLFRSRAKVFGFKEKDAIWEYHTIGEACLLQCSDRQAQTQLKLVVRDEKTSQLFFNHWFPRRTKLEVNIGSDRSWVWRVDTTNTEDESTQLGYTAYAIRFGSSEKATKFKEAFEDAQRKILNETSKDVQSQIELLKLERARIDRQIALLELQASDGK